MSRSDHGDAAVAPEPGASFGQVLETLVADAVARGASSFTDLLARLPGAWPPDVHAALDRLSAGGIVDSSLVHPLVGRARCGPGADLVVNHAIDLPSPHPLDYDWRFDERTVASLLDRCLELTADGDSIALLGAPSLLRSALERNLARRFVLLDRNRAVTDELASVRTDAVAFCDLARGPLPKLDARVIVADPPWYPAYTRAFLWAATQTAVPRARVLLSQPTPITRPGVLAERAADLSR
jgi:hypothetical protein